MVINYMDEQEKLNKEYKHLIVETDVFNLFHNIKPDDIIISDMLREMLQHKTYLRICINKIRRGKLNRQNKKFDRVFK